MIMTRQPSHPGEILRTLYMEPLSLSVTELASKLRVSRSAISALINGKCSLSVDMALRLAQAFETTPESWLNAQRNLDLWKARQGEHTWQTVEKISKITVSEKVAC